MDKNVEIQLMLTMLEMKEIVNTKEGRMIEVPSYNGPQRNELKQKLFNLVSDADKQDSCDKESPVELKHSIEG